MEMEIWCYFLASSLPVIREGRRGEGGTSFLPPHRLFAKKKIRIGIVKGLYQVLIMKRSRDSSVGTATG
jgi:hypothetical protein